jgi:hypothetical protein
MFKDPCIMNMPIIVEQDATIYTQFIYICKLIYIFRVVTPPIIQANHVNDRLQ